MSAPGFRARALVLVSVLMLHLLLLWVLLSGLSLPVPINAPVLRIQSIEMRPPPVPSSSPGQPAPLRSVKRSKPAPAPRQAAHAVLQPSPQTAPPNQPLTHALPASALPLPTPSAAPAPPPPAAPVPPHPAATDSARDIMPAAPAALPEAAPASASAPVGPGVRESGPVLTAKPPASSHVPVVASESRVAAAPAPGLAGAQFPAGGMPQRLVAPVAALASGPVSASEPRAGGSPAGPPPASTAAGEAQVPMGDAAARHAVPAAAADATAPPIRKAIALACPVQVAPEMPSGLHREPGDEWLVTAQITVNNGVIEAVKIVAGPRIFHDKVREAIRKYRCQADGLRVEATQVFRFKLGQ